MRLALVCEHQDDTVTFFDLLLRLRQTIGIDVGLRCAGHDVHAADPADDEVARRWLLDLNRKVGLRPCHQIVRPQHRTMQVDQDLRMRACKFE